MTSQHSFPVSSQFIGQESGAGGMGGWADPLILGQCNYAQASIGLPMTARKYASVQGPDDLPQRVRYRHYEHHSRTYMDYSSPRYRSRSRSPDYHLHRRSRSRSPASHRAKRNRHRSRSGGRRHDDRSSHRSRSRGSRRRHRESQSRRSPTTRGGRDHSHRRSRSRSPDSDGRDRRHRRTPPRSRERREHRRSRSRSPRASGRGQRLAGAHTPPSVRRDGWGACTPSAPARRIAGGAETPRQISHTMTSVLAEHSSPVCSAPVRVSLYQHMQASSNPVYGGEQMNPPVQLCQTLDQPLPVGRCSVSLPTSGSTSALCLHLGAGVGAVEGAASQEAIVLQDATESRGGVHDLSLRSDRILPFSNPNVPSAEMGGNETADPHTRMPGIIVKTNLFVGHHDTARWEPKDYCAVAKLLMFAVQRVVACGEPDSFTLSYGVDTGGNFFLVVMQRIGRTISAWKKTFMDKSGVISYVESMSLCKQTRRYMTYLKNKYQLDPALLKRNEQQLAAICKQNGIIYVPRSERPKGKGSKLASILTILPDSPAKAYMDGTPLVLDGPTNTAALDRLEGLASIYTQAKLQAMGEGAASAVTESEASGPAPAQELETDAQPLAPMEAFSTEQEQCRAEEEQGQAGCSTAASCTYEETDQDGLLGPDCDVQALSGLSEGPLLDDCVPVTDAAPLQASPPQADKPSSRDDCLHAYAAFLKSPDEETSQDLMDATTSLLQSSSSDRQSVATLFSLPYAALLKHAVEIEARIIACLFEEIGVRDVGHLQPKFDQYLTELTMGAVDEIGARLATISCKTLFDRLCEQRAAAFSVSFPFLGRYETSLYVCATVLQGKQTSKTLKELLRTIGSSAIKLASWTLDAAKLLDSLVAGGERAGFMRTYVYDSFVKPYAKSGASCIDQGEQDHMLRALEGSVKSVLSEIQQNKGLASGFRNVDIFLLQVSATALRTPFTPFEKARREFVLENIDPVGLFYRNGLLKVRGGTNLVKHVKTPPRPERIATRSTSMQSPRKRLRPRPQPGTHT